MGPIRTLVGFELVDSDLRIAIVRSRLGRLHLTHSLELAGFLGLSDDNRQKALATLVAKYQLSHAKAFLSLPRHLGVIRQIEFPVEIADRVRSSVALQLDSLSPWTADEVYWDCSTDTLSKGARKILATTAIIPRPVLDPWLALFKSAGLPLSGAALSSLAHAHAAVTLWKPSAAVVLVGCEPSGIEGLVVKAGEIAAFSSDIGDSDWPASAHNVLARALATCKLKPTSEARLLSFGSKAAVLPSDETERLPLENAPHHAPSLFGPVAAALLGMRKSGFNLNLIPAGERYRASHMQLLPTYVLIGLALILVSTLIFRTPYQWGLYAAELDREIESLTPAVSEVTALEADFTRLSNEYQALLARVNASDRNLDAIHELARILPPDCFLTSYNAQARTLTLTGFAQSASAVQKTLEESALFEEVQFTSAVVRDPSGKDRFSIKAVMGPAS